MDSFLSGSCASAAVSGRLFASLRGLGGECLAWSTSEYLVLAGVIVDEALGHWIEPGGHFQDPYERSDRWDGGTLARFACPAAILINRAGRVDLLERTVQVVDRLLVRLSEASGSRPLPAGVLDLTIKEIAVALLELRDHVEAGRFSTWCGVLSRVCPERHYTGTGKRQRGDRLTNYEIYASVGEWLRYRLGVADRRDWAEQFLGASLPLFTANGMYRDPGDPMLYDLSVRQNLAELLAYGYDGTHRESLQEILRRAGLCSLLMQSPRGWVPYGGRSNLFLHNEVMLAYVCEFEACRYRDAGEARVAEVFRGAARRAILAMSPFVRDFSPPHNLKNAFAPESKIGRDRGYGEYGVYSLLGASLLARTALIADPGIGARTAWPGRDGELLVLQPAFHRLFADIGETQVQMDLCGQPGYDATGVGRIHRAGFPSALGLSLSIAQAPRYITGEVIADRSVAWGPVWRARSGRIGRLAAWTGDVERDVSVRVLEQGPRAVCWEVIHHVREGAGILVVQHVSLRDGRLVVFAEVRGAVEVAGFELPCLHYDGREYAGLTLGEAEVHVRFAGAQLRVVFPTGTRIEEDSFPRASREAWYTTVTGWSDRCTIRADIDLIRKDGA